jgi:GTP-binding protein
VDLPGYGYASVSKSQSGKWGKMIEEYLLGRKELVLILMLSDIRRDPGPLDKQMMEWLTHFNFCTAVVATKSDKVGRNQILGRLKSIKAGLSLPVDADIFPFSSSSKAGFDELWTFILKKSNISQT